MCSTGGKRIEIGNYCIYLQRLHQFSQIVYYSRNLYHREKILRDGFKILNPPVGLRKIEVGNMNKRDIRHRIIYKCGDTWGTKAVYTMPLLQLLRKRYQPGSMAEPFTAAG